MPYDLCYKMPLVNEVFVLKVFVLFSAFPNLFFSLPTELVSVVTFFRILVKT